MEALIAVVVLAVVHGAAARLRFVRAVPRSRWLSAASGVSVAYVFLHLLPDVAEASARLRLPLPLEAPAFAIAFAGLIVFYGLTRAAKRSRGGDGESTSPAVFRLHLVSFAVYNAVIGYLLRAEEHESLTMFTLAMALHFAVVDYGLEEDHREPYRRYGRWVIVAAIVAGWAASYAIELPHHVLGALLAFLAGGIMLNVLKEELPDERESRFGAFLAGAIGYAALLAAL
jgi:uncharacterized membrane protein